MAKNTLLLDTSECEIIEHNGYFCFVDHDRGLITSGFGTIEGLNKYKNSFLATPQAISMMTERYNKHYS